MPVLEPAGKACASVSCCQLPRDGLVPVHASGVPEAVRHVLVIAEIVRLLGHPADVLYSAGSAVWTFHVVSDPPPTTTCGVSSHPDPQAPSRQGGIAGIPRSTTPARAAP